MIIFASDEVDFSFYFFLVYVVTDNFSSNHLTCQMSIILYSHMWKDQMTFSKQLPKIHSPKIKFAFLKSILPFSVFHGWRPPLLQANGPHTVCSAFYLLIFLVCLNCFFFFHPLDKKELPFWKASAYEDYRVSRICMSHLELRLHISVSAVSLIVGSPIGSTFRLHSLLDHSTSQQCPGLHHHHLSH